ncbi:hypothetical protein E0H82_03965 [Acinetobacter sp. ANC 4910]|uniref:hypothetical protein n=1 Tax=Acinetobacter sp. ANC 4910 TaxID=2529850 RepID=UPI0010389F75|nr:hypothetical protein [Acinetobacter sp. ANC 4910]TCB36873.1 hypothetical protein E0H82_03965 [Acinetobacter sp. ANC 4910]
MSNQITLTNEEEAFGLLEQIANGSFNGNLSEIDFGNWSKLTIRLTGEKFNSSITPTVMKGLIDVQNGIYKSYCIMRYGTESTRQLTDEERKKLEILVIVTKGSALIEAFLGPVAEELAKGVFDNMPVEAKIALILLVLFGFGTYKAISTYMANKKEIRLKEIEESNKTEVEKEQLKAELERLKLVTDSHDKNLETLAKLAQKYPDAHKVTQTIQDSQESLIRAVVAAEPESIEIQGVDIPVQAAEVLVATTRHQWLETRLDGDFRILQIDSSNAANLKIKILGVNGTEHTATLQDETMERRHVDLISKALLDRAKLFLSINAKKLGENIKDITIISAKTIE